MASSDDPVFTSMEDYMQYCIQENDNGIRVDIKEDVKTLTLRLNCIYKKDIHLCPSVYSMEGYLYLNNQTSSIFNKIELFSKFGTKVEYCQYKLDEETNSISKCNNEPLHPRQDVVLNMCATVYQSILDRGVAIKLKMVLHGECEDWKVYIILCPIKWIDHTVAHPGVTWANYSDNS